MSRIMIAKVSERAMNRQVTVQIGIKKVKFVSLLGVGVPRPVQNLPESSDTGRCIWRF